MTESGDLDSARAEVEARWDAVRLGMRRNLGLRIVRRGWWLLVLAGAVGVALGSRAGSARRLDDAA